MPIISSASSRTTARGPVLRSPGDVSTSVECYFALKLAGYSSDSAVLTRARRFILNKGGVPRTRVFTKIWLALFGQWEWSGTPNLPPELILLPSWAPFNIYEFSSWARATIVPMSIILTERPYCVDTRLCQDRRAIPAWPGGHRFFRCRYRTTGYPVDCSHSTV